MRSYKIVITLLLSIALLNFPSCLSPEGFTKATWTKDELVHWYAQHSPSNERLKTFGYRGSDHNYHYFITRQIDSFFMPRVSRTKLDMAEEHPLKSSSSFPLYYYLVDPRQSFMKVSQQ